MVDRRALGQAVKSRRRELGLTQPALAQRWGTHPQTVAKVEGGTMGLSADRLASLAAALEIPAGDLLGIAGEHLDLPTAGIPRMPSPDASASDDAVVVEPWSPTPSLRGVIPARAYEVALGYLRRLERAGIAPDELTEMEHLLIDSRFAKVNKRLKREMSEDDHVMIVDATWDIIADVLAMRGVRP